MRRSFWLILLYISVVSVQANQDADAYKVVTLNLADNIECVARNGHYPEKLVVESPRTGFQRNLKAFSFHSELVQPLVATCKVDIDIYQCEWSDGASLKIYLTKSLYKNSQEMAAEHLLYGEVKMGLLEEDKDVYCAIGTKPLKLDKKLKVTKI